MKLKLYFCGIICVCVVCIFFGVRMKSTHTNITMGNDFMMTMKVAELPEGIARTVSETMKVALPESNYIIKAKGTGEERKIFHSFMQKVEVTEVIHASDHNLSIGEEIYITKAGWRYYFDEMSMEYGFVNKMQQGKEYLVFLDCKEDTLLDKTVELPVYDLGEFIVDPIFCYEEIPNTVVAVTGESTYVPYAEVFENEFFACTEIALEYLLDLKKEMLHLYEQY